MRNAKQFRFSAAALVLVFSAGLAYAQEGVPSQPAAGQRPQGTAAADAGKPTSDAGGTTATTDGDKKLNPGLAYPRDGDSTLIADPSAPHPGKLPENTVEDPTDTSDLMPIAPLPKGNATLIGGVVKSIDPVNDRVSVQPFGTKQKWKVFFDERSKISRNGKDAGPLAIRVGDRIYLDTQLDKRTGKVFARNVRVQTKPLQADAHGQITGFDQARNLVTVHDDLSGEDVSFRLLPATVVDNQGRPGTVADLQPGALVTARFLAGKENAGHNDVNAITILAAPGAGYNFQGRVTHVDVRNHLLAVENQSDGKIYDITYDPQTAALGDVSVGSNVSINARFDGSKYEANSISPTQGVTLEEQEEAAKEERRAQEDNNSDDKHDKKHKKSKDKEKDDADQDEPAPAPQPKDKAGDNPRL